MIAFAREDFSAPLMEEMIPLFAKHYEEISRFKHIPLEPDFNHFELAQKGGVLRIFTAREGKRLVGYSVFYVSEHPHFKGSKQGIQDLIFLEQEIRKGLNGYKFVGFCDQQLESEGCVMIYQTVAAALNYGPLLERLGYVLADKVYARRAA